MEPRRTNGFPVAASTGRSRPRGAGRRGPRHRCGCQTSHPGSASTSPSTRDASPAGRDRSAVSQLGSPSFGPSTGRSRGRRPWSTRRRRRARPTRSWLGIQARQPPVGRPARDPEEDGAILGPVGVAASSSRSTSATISGMCSVARGRTSGRVIRSVRRILEEARDPALGQLVDPDSFGRGAADDLVVDVGQVHHPGHPEAAPAQVADEEVGERGTSGSCRRGRGRTPSGRTSRRGRGRAPAARAGRARRQRVVEADGHAGAPRRGRRRSRPRPGRRCPRPAPSKPARLPVDALTFTIHGQARRGRPPPPPSRRAGRRAVVGCRRS